MTLEEYEAVLAEKRAGLNQQREAAFKADEKQVRACWLLACAWLMAGSCWRVLSACGWLAGWLQAVRDRSALWRTGPAAAPATGAKPAGATPPTAAAVRRLPPHARSSLA